MHDSNGRTEISSLAWTVGINTTSSWRIKLHDFIVIINMRGGAIKREIISGSELAYMRFGPARAWEGCQGQQVSRVGFVVTKQRGMLLNGWQNDEISTH